MFRRDSCGAADGQAVKSTVVFGVAEFSDGIAGGGAYRVNYKTSNRHWKAV